MQNRLVLVDDRKIDWKLDDRTREVGRKGVEAAREALRRTARPTAA